jgi:hypothetical protein
LTGSGIEVTCILALDEEIAGLVQRTIPSASPRTVDGESRAVVSRNSETIERQNLNRTPVRDTCDGRRYSDESAIVLFLR